MTRDARFIVTDERGRSLWELERANDLECADERRKLRLWWWGLDGGNVLESNAPNRFDVVFAAEAQRVTFEVAPDASASKG